MLDRRLAAALDDCLRAIRAGASQEECIGAYPELRSRLQPLLEGAIALAGEPAADFPAEARTRLRAQLLASMRVEASGRRGASPFAPRFVLVPVLAMLVAAVLVFAQVSPFGTSGVAEADTVLSVLQGEVLIEKADGKLIAALDGMTIKASDRVITRGDGRAVLTFFDGSTIALEPDTVLLLKSIRQQNRRLHALLALIHGRAWTHVPEALGTAAIKIETPNAAAETQGTGAFQTSVTEGRTEVVATTAQVSVQSGAARADLPAGSRSIIDTPGVVRQPSAALAPERELVVRVRGADYFYLIDPQGATIGIVPPGLPVNQISGASLGRTAELKVIRIPNPPDGIYRLGLRSAADSAIIIEAVVRTGGSETVVASFRAGATETWLVRFGVAGVSIRPVGFARELRPASPVVVPETAADRARKATPADALPSATPPGRGP